MSTLAGLLEAGRPDATALVLPDEETSLAYEELATRVDAVAARLAAAGIRRGDRVALVGPDGPAFVLELLGVVTLGAVAAPLNPAYTEDEFAFYLDDLRPALLLVPPGELPAARSAAAAAGVPVAELGGSDRGRAAYEPARPDDIALLLHTSGTTSRPKQVPLLQRNLVASAANIAAHYRLGPDDVSYAAMPLFHVHGLVATVFAALHAGGTAVVPRRFAPGRLLAHLEPHGVTWTSASPTPHQMILERLRGPVAAPRLRFLRSCSAALAPAVMTRIEETFGVPVLEAYGMTEMSHQIASNPLPPGRREPGSVGLPTGTEARITERGEVAVRGPGLTPGYLANPEANAASFVDGWFLTGDLGSIDDDGYVRLLGRIKELIIRGGENISPYEVEEALLAHPAVADAACFGLPDSKYGEQVGAAVALRGEATAEELLAHCRERLAAFKVPHALHLVDAVPRTATGKLQRQRIPGILGLA